MTQTDEGVVLTTMETDSDGSSRSRLWVVRGAYIALVATLLGLILGPFPSEVVGAASIVLMLVFIFSKVHVGIAMAGPGLLGLFGIFGVAPSITILTRTPYGAVASWEYSVIPMFVLMGFLLWKSGATSSLYGVSKRYLAWLPGGLAIGTNLAGAGLAATSGSTIGTVHALGRIGMPEMLKAGYDQRMASGTILMSGLVGQIIPPSIFLVIYAGIAQTPVGPQLLAGVGPGLLITLLCVLTIVILSVMKPEFAGKGKADKALTQVNHGNDARWWDVWPVAALMALVLGGLYSGTLTATEAGAAGAAGALLVTLILRRTSRTMLKEITDAFVRTVVATGSIFLLLFGAVILSRLISVTGLATGFSTWLVEANVTKWQFLLIIIVAYLIMGMFMEPLSIMLLTVPLLLPLVESYEISSLWFGVFVVILAELAMVTPPVGILAFIFHDMMEEQAEEIGQTVSLSTIFKGVLMFGPAILLALTLILLVPAIATWIPGTM